MLAVGDVLLTVDDHPICLSGDVRTALAAHRPGDTVTLTVRRVSATADETISVALAEDSTSKRALLGVGLETIRCDVPFEAVIDTGRIIGPSAGLAITLSMIERLTPGSLTGGALVAATGTIDADGAVGPVGGVKQKAAAVRRAGAKLFLVPAEEYEIAKSYAGSMRVVAVKTLDDALEALATLPGADRVPRPS